MIDALPLLLAPEGYQISRSVRLRSSASAYLNRTPGSATNRKTWTWSGWRKRGSFSSYTHFLSAYVGSGANDSNYFRIFIPNSGGDLDKLVIGGGLTNWRATTQVFRDPSAWYHIIVAVDTTQATANNRIRIYINGSEVTSFSTLTNPTQNADLAINANFAHYMGCEFAAQNFFDGYQTEDILVDGQQLTPSSFGEFDAITGVWKPKKYAGTYGTNGFYLNFSDNSAATAAAIGKDYSGNGNNWTPNNISVTAGVTYDSMLDVPTLWADGGNGRGNYAVMNPLSSNASMTITGGNLNVTSSVGSQGFNAYSSFAVQTGQWYAEVTVNTGADADMIGVCPSTLNAASGRFDGLAGGVGYYRDGRKYIAGTATTYGASYTTGDVIGIALDMDAQTVAFYKNGVSQGTISSSLTSGVPYYFVTGDASGSTGINQSFNFGQRPFTYTPPTGFKALNTQNLPDATIPNGRKYFDVSLWTGNGSTQTITNTGAFQPDLVWGKSRSTTWWNHLIDSVRGPTKQLYSNATDAEGTVTDALTAFNANGFSLGANVGLNQNAATYVGWQWKEGATQGFDIVTFSATGVAGQTVAHSLGVAPAMVIIKNRISGVENWVTYHKDVGATKYLILNGTAAAATSASPWNNTAPSSSVVTLGNGWVSGNSHVMYAFAEVAGFSKFGSYSSNASSDGPMVVLGFRPRWVMIKKASGSVNANTGWYIFDSVRGTVNIVGPSLRSDLSDAESTYNGIDFLSNGFKIRVVDIGTNSSVAGDTYIFAAFAENPFKYSLAR